MLATAKARLAKFALEPASPKPLALLRVGIAIALIGEAAAVAPYLSDYFGPHPLVQSPVADNLAHWSLPSLDGAARFLAGAGIGPDTVVRVAFAAYVVALHLLLLGVWTRGAAIASWLLFLLLKRAGTASAYGAFEFAHIALFYCSVLPVGGAFSLRSVRRAPSAGARIGLRILQLHLCAVYLSSGITKALGEQWWNGEAIWRAVMRPHVPFDFSWLATMPLAAKAVCWATLLCETGYAVFVWVRPVRPFWVASVIALHVGIAVVLGLVFFSAVMIVLNVAAFGIDPDPAPVIRDSAAAGTAQDAGRIAADPRTAPP